MKLWSQNAKLQVFAHHKGTKLLVTSLQRPNCGKHFEESGNHGCQTFWRPCSHLQATVVASSPELSWSIISSWTSVMSSNQQPDENCKNRRKKGAPKGHLHADTYPSGYDERVTRTGKSPCLKTFKRVNHHYHLFQRAMVSRPNC